MITTFTKVEVAGGLKILRTVTTIFWQARRSQCQSHQRCAAAASVASFIKIPGKAWALGGLVCRGGPDIVGSHCYRTRLWQTDPFRKKCIMYAKKNTIPNFLKSEFYQRPKAKAFLTLSFIGFLSHSLNS